jgi:predicted AAA+ superfamily ATPase
MDDQQLVVRKDLIDSVRRAIGAYPVVALLGPRQSGKTTLARAIYRDAVAAADRVSNYFDLEDPESLARLSEPKLALQGLSGLVVIDEIQRQQNLFPLLRVLADRPERPARFLILGSASPDLVRQGSESLAGRIKYIDVTPLSLKEVGSETMSRLWLRGGYPPAFLASDDAASADWREQ